MAPIKQTHFCFDYAHLRFEGEIIIIIIIIINDRNLRKSIKLFLVI